MIARVWNFLCGQRDEPVTVPDVEAVHIDTAILCESCNFITTGTNCACRLCGSRAILTLSKLLGGRV
jgi:hypothetical protein